MGIKIAFTPIGIWIALIVVSLPFIVRAVQPVLEELSGEYEEAAATLGASRWTTFRRVLLPEITPALLTGAGMMFARSTGEYGSVIFIAGNIPMVSEILPLIITGKLEQYDAQGASAVALFMLMISFCHPADFKHHAMDFEPPRRSEGLTNNKPSETSSKHFQTA